MNIASGRHILKTLTSKFKINFQNKASFTLSSLKASTPVVKPDLLIQEKPQILLKDLNMTITSEFHLPISSPVSSLDCDAAFNGLTEKEKLYAHHLARASWYGCFIDLVQVSVESPLIYVVLSKLFGAQKLDELKKIAIDSCGFTEDEFSALLVYAAGFFHNVGNYKGFGDTKFVPDLPKEKFRSLVLASKAFESQPEKVVAVLDKCLDKMFSTKDSEKQLGYWDVGVTTYLSKNFTKKDSEIVGSFLKAQNSSDIYNTRAFKTVDETGNSCYEIRLASILTTDDAEENHVLSTHTSNGHKFKVTRGDYGKILRYINIELLKAKEYVANEAEAEMLRNYADSFRTGSLDSHKNGSRFWIKNKGPIVETYIGFIENYRDPAGMRAEFEGFVAVVNKEVSVKFSNLVANAEKLLPQLPWTKDYEKDTFLRPDFTSLDILAFGSSGVPSGINIPNYDEIRQNEGFKNVSLGNVISAAFNTKSINYLSDEDKDLFQKYRIASFDIQLGLHELMGHGSGKLFKEEKGKLNFDIESVKNLETGAKISSWYKEGEGYDSVFSAISSTYEECRAECVGLHLCNLPEVSKIFGFEGKVAEDLIYVNWLNMAHAGLESLQLYEPKTQCWLQAHSQARYVILQVMLEAGQDFVKIDEVQGSDGNPDFLLTIDRSKIMSVGKPAVGTFLMKLQLYKSTADIAKAKAMYDNYSAVGLDGKYPFLKYRDVVMARRKPRRLFVQPNTVIEDGKVVMKKYEATHEGVVQSHIERYAENFEELERVLEDVSEIESPYFT